MACLKGLSDGKWRWMGGVSTHAGQKNNDVMGGAIARSARCTSKGKELATTFDCASLANANTLRAQEERILVMVAYAMATTCKVTWLQHHGLDQKCH
jgi:hypothetical protein